MTRILAIDPGPKESAFAHISPEGALLAFGKVNNTKLALVMAGKPPDDEIMVCEMIASYGMSVGKEVFETCVWIGRLLQSYRGPSVRIFRGDIKLHLCGSMRAKDGNVRQALIDLYGGSRETAIGTKKKPGPLYGMSGDCWAALAVAVTWRDKGEELRAKGKVLE